MNTEIIFAYLLVSSFWGIRYFLKEVHSKGHFVFPWVMLPIIVGVLIGWIILPVVLLEKLTD